MSGFGRLARLVASTHAKRVRFPHPAPVLPSSIKAMRHAVNVSESGSIPSGGSHFKASTPGVEPDCRSGERRVRISLEAPKQTLVRAPARRDRYHRVRVAERRSMQISSMEHVFTRAVGTVASPTHLLESVQSRHRVPVNGLCK
jgi:hypothetical protein